MAAVVMDQAVVEPRAMVAAGALVTPRKTVPSGQLWGGRPARFMRALSEAELADIAYQAGHYRKLAGHYPDERGPAGCHGGLSPSPAPAPRRNCPDRKGVVRGKRVYVRGYTGGHSIKKKTTKR